MEGLAELIASAIFKIVKIAFRIFLEFLLPDVLGAFFEKLYRHYPKIMVFLLILFFIFIAIIIYLIVLDQ